MEKKCNVLNEVEYFTDVARIQYMFATLMKKHNLIEEIVVDNNAEKVNPFYGRIANNGAYAVEFSRGVPSIVYTPYGGISVEAAKFCRGNLVDYKQFLRDLDANFGLVEKEPVVKDRLNQVGPICALTKLPWKEKVKFPTKFENLPLSIKDYKINHRKTKQHIAEIYKTVNECLILIRKRCSEVLGSQFKSKQTQTLNIQPSAVKKRTCVIFGQIKNFLKKNSDKEL